AECGLEPDQPAVDPVQQVLRLVFEAEPPAVERVQEEPAGLALEPDQEVAGKPDARERQPEPPADLEMDHAQRDRDPDAPIQDIVQERVPGIVIRGGVAAAALLPEEDTVPLL